MDKMMETILAMDKQARLRTEEAEEYKRKAQRELGEKKQELRDKYLNLAKDEVQRLTECENRAADEQIEHLKKSCSRAGERLDHIFVEKGEEWTTEIARRAIADAVQ